MPITGQESNTSGQSFVGPYRLCPNVCLATKVNAAIKPKPKDQNEGWLWHMSGKGKMTEREMAEWVAEGNPHLHVNF